MKLFLLSLLVFTSLCFVLGDEDDIQPNFDDLIADDGQMVEDTPDDYANDEEDTPDDDAEDEEDSYIEGDEDFIPEELEDDGELRDPAGFKDDDDANQTGGDKRPTPPVPTVDPTGEPIPSSKGEGQGSGEPNVSPDEPDFKDALKDRLGLNADSDDPEFNKK